MNKSYSPLMSLKFSQVVWNLISFQNTVGRHSTNPWSISLFWLLVVVLFAEIVKMHFLISWKLSSSTRKASVSITHSKNALAHLFTVFISVPTICDSAERVFFSSSTSLSIISSLQRKWKELHFIVARGKKTT